MKAIIPTGGRGTRMRPLTFSSNKHFIPVANKPLIFYPIETIASLGIKEFGITYNPGGLEEAQNILGDGNRWGLKFTYVLQEKPAGLANIVEVCEEYLHGDSFVFHLGDNIFVDGLQEAMDHFEKKKPNGLVTMMHHKENKRMGVPYFDKGGKMTKYVEKPENPPHDFAVPGIYFADNNFFKCFKGKDRIQPSARGEYEIPVAFQWMIDHGFNVEVIEYQGKWLDPGKFDDWIEANRYLLDTKTQTKLESDLDEDVILEGRVWVGKNCQIQNSNIRGPVAIGDNVTIEDSYIGPFTSIGDGCEIKQSHVENSVLMSKVKVFNIRQPIDTSLIGTESEIKSYDGPTSHSRFFIGEKCIVDV
ncbi:MAG: glucose-1-phosphate thymidylyltransferase [Patescibacteria group bacterium]|nr:glucose-1-phosphate thymidylyltransferase [Patescibacteria group bacterium]